MYPKKSLASLRKADAREETEYITLEEQEKMWLDAFTEMYRGQKKGIKLKTAEELLHGL